MTFFELADQHHIGGRIEAPLLVGCLLLLTACPPPAQDEESSSSNGSTTDEPSETDTGPDEPQIICTPGETQCADQGTLEICAATGLEWEATACETDIGETCEPCFGGEEGGCVAACIGPCERAEGTPSSEGCSFFTTSIFQSSQAVPYPDAIIVGNPSGEHTATVTLTFAPYGSNIEEEVETVTLAPFESHPFILPAELTEYNLATSVFRSGLVHHVTSNIPIVAYLHTPYEVTGTNASALLLPEHVMTGNYVVYTHEPTPTSRPSYFVVIALENQTTVRWYPTRDTAGDFLPLPFVELGTEGSQLMNRFDNMRILTSMSNPLVCEEDLSGTVIEADKPIWVLSATRGARIPFCFESDIPGCTDRMGSSVDPQCAKGSDLIMEQNLPLEFWGREYVGPASPVRANESHVWRVFAGEDDIVINVDPPVLINGMQGDTITLAKRGEYADVTAPTGTDLYFNSNKVFMPVQYLTGDYDNAGGAGSPAMTQMVPTAQFLDNYVFVTGVGYGQDNNFVQFIREAGGGEITMDGMPLNLTWNPVGNGDWEVATHALETEGAHAVDSTGNFGIIQYGWSAKPDRDPTAGYAYPGGMKAEVIFVP